MKTENNPSVISGALSSLQYRSLFPKSIDPYALVLHASAGEHLIREGDPAHYLFLLIRGRCSVSHLLPSGRNVILRTIYPYSLIGEMELLRQQPSAMSVKALENTDLIAIPVDQCREILLSDTIFLRNLCLILGEKEREAAGKLMMVHGYPLENSLAAFILQQETDGWIRLTKVLMAESLGVSYRHLENTMKTFVERGILEKRKIHYRIADREQLEKLSEGKA